MIKIITVSIKVSSPLTDCNYSNLSIISGKTLS